MPWLVALGQAEAWVWPGPAAWRPVQARAATYV